MSLPKLPSLEDTLVSSGMTSQPGGRISADPDNAFGLLRQNTGRATDILPSLQELLMGQQAPAVQALREGGRANRAMAQSDAMKRGLTGSDIEAANMTAATSQGEQNVGQLIAAQSSQLAQYIMQAYGMDIQQNREMYVTLAQALGEEFSRQQEATMRRQDREEGIASSERASKRALWGSAIGGVGALAGGALMGFGMSDRRLKSGVIKIGRAGGLNLYRYRWNAEAGKRFNLKGADVGVLAADLLQTKEHGRKVGTMDGYLTVNYGKLPEATRAELIAHADREGTSVGGFARA